jgi:hypothetical protein
MRGKPVNIPVVETISLYLGGIPVANIANNYGCSYVTIRNRLVKWGVWAPFRDGYKCKGREKEYHQQYNKIYKEENKERLMEQKDIVVQRNLREIRKLKRSTTCAICGFDNPQTFEFHHKTPLKNGKSARVMTLAYSGCSLERIQEEIDKCVLICANCHKIIHSAP